MPLALPIARRYRLEGPDGQAAAVGVVFAQEPIPVLHDDVAVRLTITGLASRPSFSRVLYGCDLETALDGAMAVASAVFEASDEHRSGRLLASSTGEPDPVEDLASLRRALPRSPLDEGS